MADLSLCKSSPCLGLFLEVLVLKADDCRPRQGSNKISVERRGLQLELKVESALSLPGNLFQSRCEEGER